MYLSFDTVEAFAVKRNPDMSFPFLKENGELLSIALNLGFLIDPRAVNLYRDFYENAYTLISCYPQYYRFILPMVLDLEAAGMAGEQGRKITEFVRQKDLLSFDTSDVRRLEAISILKRTTSLLEDENAIYLSILERVDSLIANPDWYTKFNKPLFYDLTHIIFYLTDYGRTDLPLAGDPTPSLMNIGLLALLDNDADLLSEVCLCLGYLKRSIPDYWDTFLTAYMEDIKVSFEGTVASVLNPTVDEYHLYLVCNGYMAAQNRRAFKDSFKSQTPSFYVPPCAPSCLAKLSDYAHQAHFHPRRSDAVISVFVSNLHEDEYTHWQKSLGSYSQGQALVQAFSGLT